MRYEQLKDIENSIGLSQAKLGMLRATVKMAKGMSEEKADEVKKELEAIESNIDELQTKYITIKKG